MKALFAALILTALPLVSQADTLDVKTGAWEVAESTAITGVPVAKETLDEMPPADREKFEIAMRARADQGEPQTSHKCLTQQDLEGSAFLGSEKANCTRKVVSQTARFLEIEETCTAPEPSKTHLRVEATSVETFTAKTDRTEGQGAVNVAIRGRWIGPTCEKGADD